MKSQTSKVKVITGEADLVVIVMAVMMIMMIVVIMMSMVNVLDMFEYRVRVMMVFYMIWNMNNNVFMM